ncbi:MAG: alpha/beta fold hydrolase [Rhodospirillaceae bacterium]
MRRLAKLAGWFVIVIVAVIVGFVAWSNYRIAATETVAYDANAPGRYIVFGGHRWHFLTLGNVTGDTTGAPILLLHGFILSGHESFRTFKDKLAETRGVIAPDYLGYGHSERVLDPGRHYEINHTTKAIAAMLDELGVQQVDVVAHSYGGVIAAQFALDYPARVRRAVLMDSGQYVDISGTWIYGAPLGVGRALAWHIVSGPMSFLGTACKRNPKCTSWPFGLIEDSTDVMRAAMYTNAHSAVFAELSGRLKEVAAPSLVIVGEKDFIVPIADAERLTNELQNAKLVVIPGGSHMPYLAKFDEVYKAVSDFLQPST